MSIKAIVWEVTKDSPIIGLAAVKVFGLTLNEWILVTGVVYGFARIALLIIEAWIKWKGRNGPSQ